VTWHPLQALFIDSFSSMPPSEALFIHLWMEDWLKHVDFSSQVFDWGGIACCIIALKTGERTKAEALLTARFPSGIPEPMSSSWNDMLLEGFVPAS